MQRIKLLLERLRSSPRLLSAFGPALILFLGSIFAFLTYTGSVKNVSGTTAVAVGEMQSWLTEIDDHQYGQSWSDASTFFQTAITSDKWTAALESVRAPLGKCTSRQLASALHQTSVPSPSGLQQGDFVVAQFNSSFDNLAYAVETVCFQKESDGSWKAAGYYIKPKI
jgi:hypothetical protein